MSTTEQKTLRTWQWIGFGAVSLLGAALHFLYPLTGSTVAALFSAVNESTWEHMKLLFFPMLLFSIIEYAFFGKKYENFWCIKARGIVLGLLLIPVLFYTLNGMFGTTPDYVNIAIFFISVGAAFLYETPRFEEQKPCRAKLAILFLVLLAILFRVFTFSPPSLPLFADPLSGKYGI